MLLRSELYKDETRSFTGKNNLTYTIPNTIDAIGRELLINGVFEKPTISLIKNLLLPGETFFDVGANIGAICIAVARDMELQIHAFEPNLDVFEYLKVNISENGITANLNNKAVYSTDGIDVKFYPVEGQFGHSSLSPTYDHQSHYLVQTISIDSYCERNGIEQIDVLKIDVQGFETEVLKGCATLFSKKKITNIIFEFEDWADDVTQSGKGSSQELLRSFGYKIFTLDNKEVKENITRGSKMLWAKLPSV